MESTPQSKFYSNMEEPPLTMQSSSSSCSGVSSVGNGGFGYIKHTVTKFDTLAGVAIKYGVEIADIKRMNGLTTDLQMFALKSLQIPLPGRHLPSPVMSNGYDTQRRTSSEMTPPNRRYSDSFDSVKQSSSSQRNISLSMNALRGYYGLISNDQNSNTPLGLGKKLKSVVNGFSDLDKPPASDKSVEKLVRRRKSEMDLKIHSPETLLKQDTTSSGALELWLNAANWTPAEPKPNTFSVGGPRDALMGEAFIGVRKSSSAPSFQQSDNNKNNNNGLSIWPMSVLNLTADLQALSTAAITRPMFDGLPKPMAGRKNKMALD